MPIQKTPFIRYRFLDGLLSDKHHLYTVQKMTEKLNAYLVGQGFEPVTVRSVQKDLKRLEELFPDAEIETLYQYGEVYRRYADRDFSIFVKQLSEDEKKLLSEVLSTIGQFEGLPNFEWLDSLKKKIGVTDKADRIISFSSNCLTNSKLLGELFSAISNKQVIALSYHTFNAPQDVKCIIFHPYLLKQYNDRWFVFGAADSTKAILPFALDRIDKIDIVSSVDYHECPDDIFERFDYIVGVTYPQNATPTDVLLWVDDSQYNYIKTKPIHDFQCDVTEGEDEDLRTKYPHLHGGHFIVIEGIIINYELVYKILSYGETVIWLSPEKFEIPTKKELGITSMKEIVGKMYQNYK